MDYLFIFIASLLTEITSAAYTIALSRGNTKLAVIATIAHSLFWVFVIVNIVYDLNTLPALIAGETLGTVFVLRLAKHKAMA